MKNKGFLYFIILGVIIIAIIGVIIYFGKPLKSDDKRLTELYTYLGNNSVSTCGGLFNYQDSKVTSVNIQAENKICLAYTLLSDEDTTVLKIDKTKKNGTCSIKDITFRSIDNESDICTIYEVDSKVINASYNKIYGEDILEYIDFRIDDNTICYYADSNYYCGNAEIHKATVYSEDGAATFYRAIKNAYEKNGTITIYDYFLKVEAATCYSDYLSINEITKCTDNYSSKKVTDIKFLKKYGKAYKHTFEKTGDTYHWVVSEQA